MPYAFLVIDESGRKLKRDFSAYINRKKVIEQVKTYPINRIVSEDEGASLEGVAAVIYPGIIEASRNLIRNINGYTEPFFVGAGSWHIIYGNNYLNNFKRFMDLVYSSIDFKYAEDFGGGGEREAEIFREKRKEFVRYAKKQKILSGHNGDPAMLRLNPRYTIYRSYETGSHVLHIDFNEKSIQDILSEIVRCANKRGRCVEYKHNR